MNRYTIYCLLICVMATTRCTKKDDDQVIPQDDIIHLEFESDTANIRVDYNAVILLKAVITPTAKEDVRTVSFSASDGLGTFQGTVVEKKNVVPADNEGIARSSLKVGNTPGTYYVSAEIKGDKVYRTKDYVIRVLPPAQDDLIKIEFESDITALRADNTAIIKVKATIPKGVTEAMKNVTFSMSPGLGDFLGTATSNTSTVLAGADGIARTNIRVGGTPGTYFLAAQIKDGEKVIRTKDYPVTLVPVPDPEKLKVEIDNTPPVADAATFLKITVTAKYTLEKTVTLTTNAGAFIQSSDPLKIVVNLDNRGIGEASFQVSNTVKPHIITATLAQVTPLTTVIQPLTSWTEVILVEPSTLLVDTTSGSVKLDVLLKKNETFRKVSTGMLVTFHAFQEMNGTTKDVGRFTGTNLAISNAEGVVPSVQFIADTGGIDPLLPILIDVTVNKSATETITKRIQLKVKTK